MDKHTFLLHSDKSRFDLVTRWMVECVGVHHHHDNEDHVIYNVDNAHQCFKEVPRTIIRPFHDVDYFYGCVKCGKYHFCYQHSQTCDCLEASLHMDNDKPVCAYSFKVITDVSNDTGLNHNDTVQFGFDTEFRTYNASSSVNDYRRMRVLEKIVSRSTVKKTGPSKKEKRQIDKQDMNVWFRPPHANVKIVPEKELASDEDADDGNPDDYEEDLEVERYKKRKKTNHYPYYNEDEEEEDDACLRKENVSSHNETDDIVNMDVTSSSSHDNGDDDNDYYGSREEEEEDEEDEENGEEDDDANDGDCVSSSLHERNETSRDTDSSNGFALCMKNRHNNTLYWDCYYAFLYNHIQNNTVVSGMYGDDEEEDVNEDGHNNNSDDGSNSSSSSQLSSSIRKQQQQQHVHLYIDSANNLYKPDPGKLTSDHVNEIQCEIRRIVCVLLEISLDKPFIVSEHEALIVCLTLYYMKIIVNVARLVYHSPYIHKLVLAKHEKHEKQCKSSYSSKITVSVTDITSFLKSDATTGDTDEAIDITMDNQNIHDLLTPKKICASLMLQMFVDDFFLDDSMTNHIYIWMADPWLSSMKNRHLFERVIVDYNIIMDPLNHNNRRRIVGGNRDNARSYENLFFKKDLTNSTNIIHASLTSYSKQPQWLISMIYYK